MKRGTSWLASSTASGWSTSPTASPDRSPRCCSPTTAPTSCASSGPTRQRRVPATWSGSAASAASPSTRRRRRVVTRCSTWRAGPTCSSSRSAPRAAAAIGPGARGVHRRQPTAGAHLDHAPMGGAQRTPIGRTSSGSCRRGPVCRPTSAAGTGHGWTTSWASISTSRASTCRPVRTSSAAARARSSSPCRGPSIACRVPHDGGHERRRCTSPSAPGRASTSRRHSRRP